MRTVATAAAPVLTGNGRIDTRGVIFLMDFCGSCRSWVANRQGDRGA